MREVTLPGGETVPALGQGTWFMGERPDSLKREVDSIRLGVDLGMTLVDTAEMYGDGGAEEMLGEALRGIREKVFLVSKFYPQNASRSRVRAACERSLERLNTDVIDLYLLHWRGGTPFEETVEACERLKAEGKIRHWGVSNLDTDDMEELLDVTDGENCAVDQVLYNLTRRGPEYDLLPFLSENSVPVMAYSPIEQGRVPTSGALGQIGRKHNVSPFTVALAWVLRDPNVIAIPKASHAEHVRANRAAADLVLDAEDFAALESEFPAPRRKRPLEML